MGIYLVRSIGKRWTGIAALMAVMVFSFYIMDTAWSEWDMRNYYIRRNEEMLGWEQDRTNTVSSHMSTMPDEYVQTAEIHRRFWNEMKDVEGVGRFGAYFVSVKEDESVENPSGICIAGDLWELCRLPIASGSIEQIKTWNQEGARPVIIGNALGKKYRLGDMFSFSDLIYGKQTNCVVAGILEEGAQWFAEYYIFSQRDLVSLDYAVLYPDIPEGEARQAGEELSFNKAIWWNNMIAGSGFLYETDTDADPSEVEHRVEAVMKTCGMVGAVERADELLGEMKYAAEAVCGRQRTFGILVMCVAGMYILTAGMIWFLNRKREFGIAITCGFARRQIWLAQLAEYAVLIFASMALALEIRTAECARLVRGSGNDVLLLSHHMDTAPRVGLCAVILFAVSAAMISCLWKKTAVIDLIRSRREI